VITRDDNIIQNHGMLSSHDIIQWYHPISCCHSVLSSHAIVPYISPCYLLIPFCHPSFITPCYNLVVLIITSSYHLMLSGYIVISCYHNKLSSLFILPWCITSCYHPMLSLLVRTASILLEYI
jgi:hypothetical protein